MTAKDFLLPDLGEGLTEGEVVSWLVKVGDPVEVDQPVAEIETAKAVVEVPSPFAGIVRTLYAEVGEQVEVGKPLLAVEPAPALAGDAAAGPGEVPAAEQVGDAVPDPVPATDDSGSGSVLVGYGTSGGTRSRRRRGGAASAHAASGPPLRAPAKPPVAKPPVRKLAKDLGVDLSLVAGSGPDGLITRDDVHAHARRPAGDGHVREAEADRQVTPGTELIPLRGVRKRIADKMTLSRREIPEATCWVDCDATGLWEVREQINAGQADVKVSALAIILRACVAGLRRYPDLNASLDADAGQIVRHGHVNLGFAASTERGLVVPVIRDAHRRSILDLAAELNRLAAAARDGTIGPGDMSDGTFTVTNYGSFGVDGGGAVINHPEAAILGVGQIADRPWVVDSQLAVRKVTQLSLAFDHRICDGAEAAGFLRFVADCVERPATLLAQL